jgi:hypothetical protein
MQPAFSLRLTILGERNNQYATRASGWSLCCCGRHPSKTICRVELEKAGRRASVAGFKHSPDGDDGFTQDAVVNMRRTVLLSHKGAGTNSMRHPRKRTIVGIRRRYRVHPRRQHTLNPITYWTGGTTLSRPSSRYVRSERCVELDTPLSGGRDNNQRDCDSF